MIHTAVTEGCACTEFFVLKSEFHYPCYEVYYLTASVHGQILHKKTYRKCIEKFTVTCEKEQGSRESSVSKLISKWQNMGSICHKRRQSKRYVLSGKKVQRFLTSVVTKCLDTWHKKLEIHGDLCLQPQDY